MSNLKEGRCGGLVVSIGSTLELASQVQALARDIADNTLYSHRVSLSTQVYKWVPANLHVMLGVTFHGLASHPGRSRNTPSRFKLQKLG